MSKRETIMGGDERPEGAHDAASRRGFLRGSMLLAGTALAFAAPAAPGVARAPAAPRARRPVVAYHADQLYLDYSGSAEAYAPPQGLRTLDDHDAEALRHLVYHL